MIKRITSLSMSSSKIVLLLVVLSLGLAASVVLVQQSQDIRDRASTEGGATNIQLIPGSATLAANGATPIDVRFNSGDVAIDGVQVIATLTPSTQGTVTFESKLPSGLTEVAGNPLVLDQSSGTYTFKFAAVTTDPQTRYSTNGADVVLGSFSVNYPDGATLDIVFDTLLSRVAQSQTSTDVLSIPTNQTYAFSDGVVADGGSGNDSNDSSIGGGCSAPTAPANLTATAAGSNAVTLQWTTGPSVEHYFINYGPSSGQYKWGVPNAGITSEYTIGNLSPNTVYYFAVAAVNECATSYLVEVTGRTAFGSTTGTTGTTTITLPAQPSTPKGGTRSAPTYQFGTPRPTSRPASMSAKNLLVSPTPRPTAKLIASQDIDDEESGFQFSKGMFFILAFILFVIFLMIIRSRRQKKTWHSPSKITGRGPKPTVNE